MGLRSVLTLMGMMFEVFIHMFTSVNYLMLIGLVLLMVYFQYRRVAAVERQFLGNERRSAASRTLTALGYGLLGGVIGSMVFLFTGVSLTRTGVIYLWIVALALMLVHPRFICFAYSGGIVGLSHLLFGKPDVEIPALISLVAILHAVESILIRLDGHHDAVPVYVKTGDRIAGGFTMQKFWPLPVVALVALVMEEGVPGNGLLSMPEWWPLIGGGSLAGPGQVVYVMFPVVAGLGYGEMALSRSPRSLSTKTAGHLLSYSLALLASAFLADRFYWGQWIAVLLAPAGHEVLIQLGRYAESRRPPLYVAPERGIMVLDVVPDSPAEAMDIRPGDLILRVNGIRVNKGTDIDRVVTSAVSELQLEVEGRGGNVRTLHWEGMVPSLGILPVPGLDATKYVQTRSPRFTLLRRLLRFSKRLS